MEGAACSCIYLLPSLVYVDVDVQGRLYFLTPERPYRRRTSRQTTSGSGASLETVSNDGKFYVLSQQSFLTRCPSVRTAGAPIFSGIGSCTGIILYNSLYYYSISSTLDFFVLANSGFSAIIIIQ